MDTQTPADTARVSLNFEWYHHYNTSGRNGPIRGLDRVECR